MISYIKGTLAGYGDGWIIVETGGIGYRIFVSSVMLPQLPKIGEDMKIHIHMNVKEDGISLYGFSSAEEQELFHRLLSVSGVGPKGALGFLAQLRPHEVIMAILAGDVQTLCKAPGIGKKTAQRVILELKDKFQTADAVAAEMDMAEGGAALDARAEAVEALTALGYSRSEAASAVNKTAREHMTTEEILKAALRKF